MPFDSILGTAQIIHEVLGKESIPHYFVGGIAVRLHGAMHRETGDVDLVIRQSDWPNVVRLMKLHTFTKSKGTSFVCKNVRVDFRFGGQSELAPDPKCPCVTKVIEAIPVLELYALLELKLLSGIEGQNISRPGKRERSKKHFADVVILLQSNSLLPRDDLT